MLLPSLRLFSVIKAPAKRRVFCDEVWSHHLAVAPLEPDDQREWLETAKREGMSRETLRDTCRSVSQFVYGYTV